MRTALRLSVVGVLVSTALVGLPAGLGAGDPPSTLCERFGEGEETGRAQFLELDELSGLIASRRHRGVLWAHNDSGGRPELFALSEDGQALGMYEVEGTTNIDWEDIAIGPAPGRDGFYLYIGDIGDNASGRDHVTVYRVAEPSARPSGEGEPLSGAEAIHLRYPHGAEDAEALIVDPWSGDLYILTKNWSDGVSTVLRAPAAELVAGATVTMTDVGRFDPAAEPGLLHAVQYGRLVTAADASPDGRIVLVRTYSEVLAYERADGDSLHAVFSAEPCAAPQRLEAQGEAIAFADDGAAYFTASEGPLTPIHRFEVTPPARR